MTKINEEKLALTIAGALLLKNGEVSIEDIQSFPFLSQEINAQTIAGFLLGLYDAELVSKKISSSPFLRWEQVISLNKRPEKEPVLPGQ
jgi:hypothetical protein